MRTAYADSVTQIEVATALRPQETGRGVPVGGCRDFRAGLFSQLWAGLLGHEPRRARFGASPRDLSTDPFLLGDKPDPGPESDSLLRACRLPSRLGMGAHQRRMALGEVPSLGIRADVVGGSKAEIRLRAAREGIP